jgi:hypothetical protein
MKMLTRLSGKLSYANVIASLALFIALGGAAVAAGLAKNSVGTKQLKPNAVTAAKIKNGAVNSHKLAHGAVVAGKLGANSVSSGVLQNGSVLAAKLAKNSVTNAAIANGVVGTNKLGNNVVTTAKLADGSVTAAKLGPEVAPLLGTLKKGQTLRGIVYASATDPTASAGDTIASTGVSYQFPLENPPTTNIVDPNTATTAACPGITGGNGQTPQAAAGQLCVYVTGKQNAESPTFPSSASNRLGFAIEAKSGGAAGSFSVVGQWAVTAP